MRKVKQIDFRTVAWGASSTLTIPTGFQDFWITGIQLTANLYIVGSGGDAPYQDWLARSVGSVLINDGGRQYAMINGTPDLRAFYWGLRQRMQGRFRMPDALTGSRNYQWDLPLVFSPEPLIYDDQINWWDPRVGIRPSAGLQIQINTLGATSPGNVKTITAAASCLFQVTYYGVIPEAGDPVPAFYPNWQTLNFHPTGTGGGLQVGNQINPGPYYRRTHQMLTVGAQDGSSDLRSNGATYSSGAQTLPSISEVGITTADNRHPIYQKTWEAARNSQSQFEVSDDNSVATAYAASSAAPGVAILNGGGWNVGCWHEDWSRYLDGADPVFGQNSAGKANNWLSTGYSADVITNVNVGIFHEAYLPY